jgi:diacylglycerol kinase (ATP)
VPDAPIALLANPTAAHGRYAGLLRSIAVALGSAGRPVRILPALDRAGAAAAVATAVRDGVGALVMAGGDGTVHLGLQAVAGTGMPFGVVPVGSGNDFADALGLPADPVRAAEGAARALAEGRTRAVDLARMTGADGAPTWFGAVLGAGFDSIVNERANRMRFPRGPRRYDIAVFTELIRLRPRHYTITLDGVAHERTAVLVAVGNTASYGGGMRICPDADPTDGLLDVVVADPISRWTLTRLKPRLTLGTHVTHPAVHVFRAREVVLAAEGITTYADGERTAALPVRIEAVPAALNLLEA